MDRFIVLGWQSCLEYSDEEFQDQIKTIKTWFPSSNQSNDGLVNIPNDLAFKTEFEISAAFIVVAFTSCSLSG